MATKKKDELAESYKQVQDKLSDLENNKPGDYQGQYTGQVQSILDKIMNRQEFNYDMNADPLYQQYKNQYTALGKNAMRDTVGNVSALTGGYASTAAASAGQQAYNSYLQQLNNIVPELYNAALNRYQMQGDNLYNQMGILQNLDSLDYNRYRDRVNDYYNALDYYGNRENTIYNRDYALDRDAVSDSQWERQFSEQQKQNQIANDQWEKNYALQKESADAQRNAAQNSAKQELYSAIQNRAVKYDSPEDAKAYLERMVNLENIDPEDAAFIYQVYVGGSASDSESNQDRFVPVSREELLDIIGKDKPVLTEAQFHQEKENGYNGKYSSTLGSKNYYEYLANVYELYMK